MKQKFSRFDYYDKFRLYNETKMNLRFFIKFEKVIFSSRECSHTIVKNWDFYAKKFGVPFAWGSLRTQDKTQ